MDTNERTAGYWVTAIIMVLALAAAVWWYTASDTVLVPNTGTVETDVLNNSTIE